MHQPYYKNLWTGTYLLPWVMLHGTKDYFDMAFMLKEFDGMKQNFNVVPSLLLQLEEYAEGKAKDIYLEIFRKNAKDLSREERIFVLTNFFNANWENMIRPFPRYYELLAKRGFYYSKKGIAEIAGFFTPEEIRDIQILFFLSWIDPCFFDIYDSLKELKKKGKGFSEEDKKIIEDVQRKILGGIVPLYRELSQKGIIELSTSPFYHPILPLLIDTDIAHVSTPERKLPKRFRRPEDASEQIRTAIDFFSKIFDKRPKGMWPPEGSVSDDALRLLIHHGIEWTATDEEILFLTLNLDARRDMKGIINNPEILYCPYAYSHGQSDIKIIFRDKVLSDLISFQYASFDPKEAANDFVGRLKAIYQRLPRTIKRPLVTIIMDGENAWEYYKNDGRDFLQFLYENILNEAWIRPVTVSDYLEEEREIKPLYSIFPGSWISHNFSIWIGHIEDNTGWELLSKARDFLEREDPKKTNNAAWQSLYIAEGSDWFWWYGDEHSSENDEVFDFLFRENLSNVYRLLGVEPPAELSIPVLLEDREVSPTREPLNLIHPKIDGYVTDYFEWLGSGFLEGKGHGVAMHETSQLVKGLYFGFDERNLYIRIDLDRTYIREIGGVSFEINILGEKEERFIYEPKEGKRTIPGGICFSFANILEMEIPITALSIRRGGKVKVCATVKFKGMAVDRIPRRGFLVFMVPYEDFEKEMWYV